MQELYIEPLVDHVFELQDEEPAILSASDVDIRLNGTSEESISIAMENGGSQLSVDMEGIDIAFLNEAGFSLLGEYFLDREAFATIDFSLDIQEENIEGKIV